SQESKERVENFFITYGESSPVVRPFEKRRWYYRRGITLRSHHRKDHLGKPRNFGLHQCLLLYRDERCFCWQPICYWHFPHLLSLCSSGRHCYHYCRYLRDWCSPLSNYSGCGCHSRTDGNWGGARCVC